MIRRIAAHLLQAAHDYLDGRYRRERAEIKRRIEEAIAGTGTTSRMITIYNHSADDDRADDLEVN